MALDIGVDFGTSLMIAGSQKSGITVREPAIIAIHIKTKKVLAIGSAATSLVGREQNHVEIIYPIEHGVIANYKATEILAAFLLKKTGKGLFLKPRIVVAVPSQITNLEGQAMIDIFRHAGARQVKLIHEPVAAAMGYGFDISKPVGRLVVNIGSGTTDVSVVSMNAVIASASSHFAGNALNEAIAKYLKEFHNLLVGAQTVEKLKQELASFIKNVPNKSLEVKGRSSVTGLPVKVWVHRSEIYPAVREVGAHIVATIQAVLEQTPPELTVDISKYGMLLTGGGALATGIAELLEGKLHIAVQVPENPLEVAMLGTLKSFDNWNKDFEGFFTPKASL